MDPKNDEMGFDGSMFPHTSRVNFPASSLLLLQICAGLYRVSVANISHTQLATQQHRAVCFCLLLLPAAVQQNSLSLQQLIKRRKNKAHHQSTN